MSFVVSGLDGSVEFDASTLDHRDVAFLNNLQYIVNWTQERLEIERKYTSTVRNKVLNKFRCTTIRGEQNISLGQLKKYLLKSEYERLSKNSKYIPLVMVMKNITENNKIFKKSFLAQF